MATAEQWLGKLARLRVDNASGNPAPHKPLLLLVLLDLAEGGQLSAEGVRLTPELAFRFNTYSSIVAARRRQRPDVRYPFYHLKTAGFWRPLTADGTPATHRTQARAARLDPDLLALMADPGWREKARRLLIAQYFPAAERVALYSLVGLPVPTEEEVARDADFRPPEEAAKKGRDARFRMQVVAAYSYTCALTGYRLNTVSGASIVDAAHIHQFADSRNNEPQNGLALCKNAHWLFDNGLWTLTDEYRVMVAKGEFEEAGSEQHLLQPHEGQAILLPRDRFLWPAPEHLEWHRRKKFKRSQA